MSKVLVEKNPVFNVTILNTEMIQEIRLELSKIIQRQTSLSEHSTFICNLKDKFENFLNLFCLFGKEVLPIFGDVLLKLNPQSKDHKYISIKNQETLIENRFEILDLERLNVLMNEGSDKCFRIIGPYQFERIVHSIRVCSSEWLYLLQIWEIIDCLSQGKAKLSRLKGILTQIIKNEIILDESAFLMNPINIMGCDEDYKPKTPSQINISTKKRLDVQLRLKKEDPEMFAEIYKERIIRICQDSMGPGKLLNIRLQEIIDSLNFDSGCRGFGQIYSYQKDITGKIEIKPQICMI